MSAIIKYDFRGDSLDVVRLGDGDIAIPLRRLCDLLGVDVDTQAKKLRASSWATTVIMPVVAEDGKLRDVLCIHRRSIALWAASINANKVAPDLRPKLVAYQIECADILADHFLGKRGAPRINTEEAVGVLCQQSMRVCDDEKAEKRLRRAIRNAVISTNRTWQAIEGFVRRKSGAPGWKRVALFNVDRLIELLEDVADGEIMLPRPKAHLRLLPAANQLALFGPRRRT